MLCTIYSYENSAGTSNPFISYVAHLGHCDRLANLYVAVSNLNLKSLHSM